MNELEQARPRPDDTLLLDSYRHSLWLQQMRIAALHAMLQEREVRILGMERSTSWRLTASIRAARLLAAGRLPSGLTLQDAALRARAVLGAEGVSGLRRRIVRRIRPDASSPAAAGLAQQQMPEQELWQVPVTIPAHMRRSVLIIAELTLQQCAKYRVWQKQEHFHRLGWPCQVVGWNETSEAFSALQCCTHVIFYRVPARPPVLAMIAEAKRLGLQPFWEVDDLIFDEALFRQNTNLATLPPSLREGVLSGVPLYRNAMLACGRSIASTPMLAECMRVAGIEEVGCVENALDDETMAIATDLRRERDRRAASDTIVIVYGSGTKTHDADFAVAAAALERLLDRHPALRLRVIGELNLPASLQRFDATRLEALPGTDYAAYLRLLSEADIAIAPLEDRLFNDAKSNIKFQEASILGIPSVSSPRAAFRQVVVQDHNGLLAATSDEWEQALEKLILEASLRDRLGRQALADVVSHYAPERIATTQLAPLFGPAEPASPDAASGKLRVLVANVYFSPRSFGGATIVAEELARRLQARGDCLVSIFTSLGELHDRPPTLLRYDCDGMPVFASALPPSGDHVASFDNPEAVRHFAAVLDAVRPDVVHAHCVQGFGAGILRLCHERGIPYVVTLHDAWWLCDRQFMVRGDGRYCFQTRIDLRVCQACVPHARHLESRAAILHQVLDGAAHLLSPSASHRQLHLANGLADRAISVNRNGIQPPLRPRTRRRPGSPKRFGYVGGAVPIKGYPLVREAFETIASAAWKLVMVDNTLNLGFRSIDVSAWKVAGEIEVVPAYRQDGLDDFFDGIDVLLFPSQWKESYGLTVREALARDVWVITTAPGGQSEEVIDGVNGRHIPLDGQPDRLVAAIEEILAEPDRLVGYSNPYRETLADYATQARELHAVLQQAALSEARP